MDSSILTLVAFLPIVGVLLISFTNKDNHKLIKAWAWGIAFIDFLLSLYIYFNFDVAVSGFQFEYSIPWISHFGINYSIGIDGISLWLVILTTFLGWLAIWSSWTAVKDRLKGYMVSLLVLQTGMLGVFVSMDLFLFYVFWEVMLIPMYFLIGIWGGPRKIYATVKFVLFTMLGSLLMLVAILFIYFKSGSSTFNISELTTFCVSLTKTSQLWLFAAFGLAFAIKVPMFPFHTWLPDAHVQAPTAGSVILAGVLLKMGTYGFLRFCMPMFPQAFEAFIPVISILAIIGIIYGALVAMVQKDVKSLVAFSSVSHMGFIMLGMCALNMQGLQGSILQMLNHGISTGALFMIVGMIYERRHTRMISDFGGLFKTMPIWSTFFIIVALSSIGLPFTNGFVGEFLILVGTFGVNPIFAGIAATGVILAACYMLWMIKRVLFGEITHEENRNIKDLKLFEKLVLVPFIILIFWIGIYPSTFLNPMKISVEKLISDVGKYVNINETVNTHEAYVPNKELMNNNEEEHTNGGH
jgi:NADH-quinone oxidoreductase subunit M